MDPFNALSTTAAARKIPPLKEAPLAMVCGQWVPRDEGRSPPARQGSPCTRGHGMHPARGPPVPIDRTYTSHNWDPHSEEGDHPMSTHGPFEQ
jgi:hypothetical protein